MEMNSIGRSARENDNVLSVSVQSEYPRVHMREGAVQQKEVEIRKQEFLNERSEYMFKTVS